MDEIEVQLRRLLDGDRREREHAAAILRGRRFDVARLAPVLAHPHVSRRVKAIEILRVFHTAEAVELVLPFLAAGEYPLQSKAVSTLGRIGRVAIDRIAAELDRASTMGHRLAILDVLSRFGHPRARETLLVVADAWEPHQRASAIAYLRRFRDDIAVAPILGALADRETRTTAIEVAGRVRHPAFLASLITIALDESYDSFASGAPLAIAKYGVLARDALVARADGAQGDVRRRITRLLRWVLRGEVEAGFWELWERPEPAVRDACLEYLGGHNSRSLPGDRVRRALAEHVADPDPARRIACIAGLRRLGERESEAARRDLEPLCADPDPGVAEFAARVRRDLGR